VFNVHNSHLWARDKPHAIRAIRERGVKSPLQRQSLGSYRREHCHFSLCANW
jgi:hypothetical protein